MLWNAPLRYSKQIDSALQESAGRGGLLIHSYVLRFNLIIIRKNTWNRNLIVKHSAEWFPMLGLKIALLFRFTTHGAKLH